MDTAHEIANVAWWKKAGLPGMPVTILKRRRLKDASELVRGADGKMILFESHKESLRDAFSRHFRREIDSVMFVTDIEEYERFKSSGIPGKTYTASVVGYALASGGPLTITERIEAKVIADIFADYAFVNPIAESYRLPRIFDEYRQDHPGEAWGVPGKVASEEKAFQLAQVAERVLGTPAEIVPEPDGSYFVVIPHVDRITRDDALLRLSYAIDLLNLFNITPSDENVIAVEEDGEEMYNRSRDGAEAYMIHKRVESKLDAVLARLDCSAKATDSKLNETLHLLYMQDEPVKLPSSDDALPDAAARDAHTVPAPRKAAPNKRNEPSGKGKATKASA